MNQGKNQIYSIADSEAEYKGYKRLLSSESFSVEDINKSLLKKGASKMCKEKSIYVIEDGSEIRKKHSKKLDKLMMVRSLDGKLVNGYRSENTIAVTEDGKKITLTTVKVFSSKEEGFKSENVFKFENIKETSKELRKNNKKLQIIYVKDRAYDDKKIFKKIRENKSDFIIRAKHLKRIIKQGEKDKKVNEVKYSGNFLKKFTKLKIKNRVYQNITLKIKHAKIRLEEQEVFLVKVQLLGRGKQNIFREPLILITSLKIKSDKEAFKIYRGYLKRWKIESVFQFIKETLGWEGFRIRDIKGIKKIISLTYFVAAYFYELGQGLIKEEFIDLLISVGHGKGKRTRKFLIEGLQIFINSMSALEKIKKIPKNKLLKLYKEIGYGEEAERIFRCVQF